MANLHVIYVDAMDKKKDDCRIYEDCKEKEISLQLSEISFRRLLWSIWTLSTFSEDNTNGDRQRVVEGMGEKVKTRCT